MIKTLPLLMEDNSGLSWEFEDGTPVLWDSWDEYVHPTNRNHTFNKWFWFKTTHQVKRR